MEDKWITFTSSDIAANESAYDDANARIESVDGVLDADTTRWSQPIAHPTEKWIRIKVPARAMYKFSEAEQASMLTDSELIPAGWLNETMGIKTPWWGFLVWWK